ncbi:2660_t:CDS:2 [Ambispora gerdemannii]|uniref:2660_t:CDS:1 n=1 Tax=Ambispora gerdemannii TaxID=144530 RepID=A0A9N9AAT9_9GLOM|nr:2660_t:CDS:2 [Ambispora gerdemannii]
MDDDEWLSNSEFAADVNPSLSNSMDLSKMMILVEGNGTALAIYPYNPELEDELKKEGREVEVVMNLLSSNLYYERLMEFVDGHQVGMCE